MTTETAAGAARPDARLAGFGLMIVAMLAAPGIDLMAKLLGPDGAAMGFGPAAPAPQIAFARFLVQTAVVAPLVLLMIGTAGFLPRNPGLAALRGALIALATLLFFAGLRHLDIATAISIFFVEPLILTVLSAVFLGETIGWRRIVAVLVGLGGALIIIQPNFIAVGWPALLPLGAAFFFANYLVLTKRLAAEEHALTLHLWAGGVGALLLGATVLALAAVGPADLAPILPTPTQWGLFLALGLIATGVHFLVVLAFQRAPASVLAPFQYLEIVSASLLGWLVLAERPAASTWLGVSIIIAAGVYVIWRERLRAEEG